MQGNKLLFKNPSNVTALLSKLLSLLSYISLGTVERAMLIANPFHYNFIIPLQDADMHV